MPATSPARAGRPHWRLAALGITLALLGLILGEVLTRIGAARTGELSLDESIAVGRNGLLIAVARFLDVAAGPLVAPLLALVAAAVLARRDRWAAAVFLFTTIGGWVSVTFAKVIVGRLRPPTDTVHALIRESGRSSFPSGHTAFAVAAVGATLLTLHVLRRSTRVAWAVGIVAVVVVAASRLYLGAHYLGDVAGSALFAGGAVLVIAALEPLAAVHAPRVLRASSRAPLPA